MERIAQAGILLGVIVILFGLAVRHDEPHEVKIIRADNMPLEIGQVGDRLRGREISEADSCKVSRAQYRRLANGMSYFQVRAILGCEGSELSRSDVAGYTTVMYMWEGTSFGANMNAMFQNDELVSKAQFGLR
jgi:hypothetical protein